MFNLLPEIEQKLLRREYRLRVAVCILEFLLFTIVVAAIFEIAKYYIYRTELDEARLGLYSVDNKNLIEDALTFERESVHVNNLIKIYDSNLKLSAYDIVAKSMLKRPDGVAIDDFNYSLSSGEFTLVLRGVAPDRVALQSLKSVFEQESIFNSVYIPLSDFAKSKELVFSLTAKGKL